MRRRTQIRRPRCTGEIGHRRRRRDCLWSRREGQSGLLLGVHVHRLPSRRRTSHGRSRSCGSMRRNRRRPRRMQRLIQRRLRRHHPLNAIPVVRDLLHRRLSLFPRAISSSNTTTTLCLPLDIPRVRVHLPKLRLDILPRLPRRRVRRVRILPGPDGLCYPQRMVLGELDLGRNLGLRRVIPDLTQFEKRRRRLKGICCLSAWFSRCVSQSTGRAQTWSPCSRSSSSPPG